LDNQSVPVGTAFKSNSMLNEGYAVCQSNFGFFVKTSATALTGQERLEAVSKQVACALRMTKLAETR
jgi:hypothetical protein